MKIRVLQEMLIDVLELMLTSPKGGCSNSVDAVAQRAVPWRLWEEDMAAK
jgi:hypothetical protein